MAEATSDLFSIIENKGIAPVTLSETRGSPRAVFGLWMAANIEFATLTTGALATGAFGLSAGAAFVSILIANIFGGILLAVLSTFGVQYGLPQMIQGSAWFGRLGNKLPSLLNFLGGFSWFAVNTIIGAYAVQYFLHTNLIVSIIGLSIIQVAIAFIGHDLIHTAEKYFVYVLVLIFLALTIVAVQHLGLSIPANAKSMAAVGGFSGAFLLTTSIMVGYVVGWAPYSSDYTRYLRADANRHTIQRTVFTYAFWGSLISTVWIESLGALIGASVSFAKPSDLFTAWMPDWLKAPLLLAVIIGTISANILNIYSATMSALALGLKLKQHRAALLTGIIGTLISDCRRQQLRRHLHELPLSAGLLDHALDLHHPALPLHQPPLPLGPPQRRLHQLDRHPNPLRTFLEPNPPHRPLRRHPPPIRRQHFYCLLRPGRDFILSPLHSETRYCHSALKVWEVFLNNKGVYQNGEKVWINAPLKRQKLD